MTFTLYNESTFKPTLELLDGYDLINYLTYNNNSALFELDNLIELANLINADARGSYPYSDIGKIIIEASGLLYLLDDCYITLHAIDNICKVRRIARGALQYDRITKKIEEVR